MPMHPALVHLPLALAVLLPPLALALFVGARRLRWAPSTWWLVVVLQAALVGSAFLALKTGEADEDRVEARVGEAAIDAHEEAAQLFTGVAVAVLGLAAATAFVRDDRRRWIGAASTVGAMVAVAALAVRVGHAGGTLVHGSPAATTAAEGNGTPTDAAEAAASDDDDDD